MPEISKLMAQTLAEMSVVSEQKGASYDGDPVHTNIRDHSPGPLRDEPMVDEFRRRWAGASSERAKLEVIRDAREALRRAKISHAEPEGLTRGTVEWRAALARDGRPTMVVADAYKVSRQYVWALRKQMADER